MFKNYIKIAFRNLFLNKMYSFINLLGLTVGLACSLLIFLYVYDEVGFDKIHTNYENIHRLDSKYQINDSFSANLDFPAGLAPLIKEEVAELANTVRYERKSKVVISNGTDRVYEQHLSYTDPSFFEMFNFDLEQGSEESALVAPYSLVISKEISEKYFSGQNPIGKTLTIDEKDYQITGLLAAIPHNTHFKFSMLASFETLSEDIKPWSAFPNYRTYIELNSGSSLADAQSKILDALQRNMGENGQKYTSVESYPIADIYLKVENFVYDELRGNIEYVKIFLAIGLLILGIACINFMNLTTARASLRSKEIGIRKSSGAFKKQIVYQFLSESILITLISAILAIVLMELMLPGFNLITGKELALNLFESPQILAGILGVSVLTGVFAGLYPALFLSGFKPVSVLKGQFKTSKSAIFFRKGLVVTQFVITIGLIVSSLIMNNQLQYLQDRGLGIDSEALVSIPAKNDIGTNYASFKTELLKNPDIANVTTGSLLLGGISFETYSDDDGVELKPKSNILQVYNTDHDFVSTLGLEVFAGRDFDIENVNDFSNSILVNETSIREFGWENHTDAIGQEILLNEKSYSIVGVVQDFHAFSPSSGILPTAIKVTDKGVDQVLIRLQTNDLGKTITSLKETWTTFEPFLPFEINFMDDELNEYFKGEQNLRTLFGAFAFLTIFIACLGLFGLATFTAEQRKKEIGIRKVLGASVERIIAMISKDFLYLVLIGFALATPITWYFMNEWIQNYPYRIDIGVTVFAIAGISALAITMITVSFHSIKSALSNPVDSLKND